MTNALELYFEAVGQGAAAGDNMACWRERCTVSGNRRSGDAPISVSIRTGSIPPKADVLRRLDKVYLHARERAGITMTPIYDEVQGADPLRNLVFATA